MKTKRRLGLKMDDSRRAQYFLQYHCIKWFWKALKAIMLVLLFQLHFHCFSPYLSRFVQPKLVIKYDKIQCAFHCWKMSPMELYPLLLCDIQVSPNSLMLLLYFCCRINSKKINACRMRSSLFWDISYIKIQTHQMM